VESEEGLRRVRGFVKFPKCEVFEKNWERGMVWKEQKRERLYFEGEL